MKRLSKLSVVLIFFCLTVLQTSVYAQKSYLGYYDLVNRAEELLVAQNDASGAMKLYDRAFAEYPKPFVKDYYIAAQTAVYHADTARFLRYTQLCFGRGMSFRCLNNAKVLAPVLENTVLLKSLKKLHGILGAQPVDTAMRDSVYMRFHHEQTFKRAMGVGAGAHQRFGRLEKANVAYFAARLDAGIFPSEQLIGLYTDEGFNDFMKRYGLQPFEQPLPATMAGMALTAIPEDYSLWNQAAFVSFLHYPCSFIQYRDGLWKAVENGYLHPKDYCMLHEWYAASLGKDIYLNDCAEERQPYYYNITPALTATTPKALKRVEAARSAKRLQKYSVDVLKKQWEKEKGFVFFFGFFDYR